MQEIEELKKGVIISVDGKAFKTLPCKPSIFSTPPNVFERHPPIRHRLNVPDSWMRLILHEGKNRQVRKMTASVGHPTLRLIRYRIERLTIENLRPGEIKELAKEEMYSVLFYNRNSG
jgi:23S rRNA pseudouridine2457 synthase